MVGLGGDSGGEGGVGREGLAMGRPAMAAMLLRGRQEAALRNVGPMRVGGVLRDMLG